jgi:5-methylcytosine-specific restriction endonuclease McrA
MKKLKSIKYLRNKADRLLQQIGRKIYSKCEICGKPMDCLHHFITKASSSYLRYYWDNLIPICTSCHVKIELRKAHELTAIIVLKRGEEWLKGLTKKAHLYVKTDRKYYEYIISNLKKML